MKTRNKKTHVGRSVSVLRRLTRNDSGATAIEFAMVAVPFLAFLFMTLEVAFIYGGTVSLEHALEKSARKIRVGQTFASLEDFKNDICSHVVLLSGCSGKLIVDVRTLVNFGAASGADVMSGYVDGSGDLNDPDPDDPGQYDPGVGSSVVLVNVFYKWDVIAKLPTFYKHYSGGSPINPLGNQSDGSRVMSATVAFKNEPFPPS